MSWFSLSGSTGQRKYNLTIFFATLAFILALFQALDETVSKCLVALFVTGVGGNVGAKIATALPTIFGGKKSE